MLVGPPMAGLRGRVREARLPNSGIVVRPTVEIDLAAPSGGPGDPILYQALKSFDR